MLNVGLAPERTLTSRNSLLALSPDGRMVKEFDLFETNQGCGLSALSQGNIRNRRNTTLHGAESARKAVWG